MSPTARLKSALAVLLPEELKTVAVLPSTAMPMHMGLDSHVTVLQHDGGLVFAKAFKSGALDPYGFAGAAEGARRAGEAGIGPRLLAADSAREVLVLEHPGPDWRMALAPDLQRGQLRETVVLATRRWHAEPALPAVLSPFDLAEELAQRLNPQLGQGTLLWKGEIPFAAMRAWVVRIGEALAAAGKDSSPVRGENVASNVLLGPSGRVLLVDFDRAVMADPFWDLGALSLELCRTETERAEVAEIYAGRAEPRVLARMKLYGLVDDFIWGAWALIADDGPETAGPELYKYANGRLARFVHHLDRFDAGALLGRV